MKIIFFVGFLLFLSFPQSVRAAYFFFDASTQNIVSGHDFSVNVLLHTENVSSNAVSGAIFVENNSANIIEISTKDSIVNFWTVKPLIAQNIVYFEGVILNPGYNGKDGQLFSIRLQSKKAGEDSLVFSEAAIHANDGKGTKILSQNKKMNFLIVPQIDPLHTKLVRIPGSSAVYFIKNNRRYIFLNERIYKTWFVDFSHVETVDEVTLARYLIGGFIKPRPNVLMFKITTDPRVYLVSNGGELRWVENEAVAFSLFGPLWARNIVDISDAEIAGFSIGKSISSKNDVTPFQGSLLDIE